MSLILGIDTGGTYTDVALIDNHSRQVLAKAKSHTTREDLCLGITDAIRCMGTVDYTKISCVSLSTTLATNAIVEGRGCEVGLLLLGFEQIMQLPVKMSCMLPGGHNTHGREKQPFDAAAVRCALEEMRGQVDALAISSYLSIRNPEHELMTQKLAHEMLGIPAVCAHHLTRSLGIKERTVTAVLNARLIPTISELIQSVKTVLADYQVGAPIMVVRGDGSLMGESQALQTPIETILSGPAASIIGASFLTKEEDAMILDMGGTTVDIAVLKNGVPRLNHEGARVGGWLTRVEAAEINTYGLGGDSYIQMDDARQIHIGPQRVWPFCIMAARYPYLRKELEGISQPRKVRLVYAQICDCYVLLSKRETVVLSGQEQAIVDQLQDGPHSHFVLAKRLGVHPSHLDLSRLINTGLLGRISITPTDILHVLGRYCQWDAQAAHQAVAVFADRLGMPSETFSALVVEKMNERLCYATWQSLLNHDNTSFDITANPLFDYFSKNHLGKISESFLSVRICPTIPIIGIGAPVNEWLPALARALNARLIIPQHTEVANAVGAAAGRIMEVVRILVSPGENGSGFEAYSAYERSVFEHLEEALSYSLAFAKQKAWELAEANGAKQLHVVVQHKEVFAKSSNADNDIFIESQIEAIASERPEWA